MTQRSLSLSTPSKFNTHRAGGGLGSSKSENETMMTDKVEEEE